jgi:hypothetical protein
VKDLDVGEVWANYTKSYSISALGDMHRNEFTMWNSAYLERTSSATDAQPDAQDILNQYTNKDYYRDIVKFYI